jgi:catechol 2,3-dioxygenase-like lactoylglutathione lyase family enzyme
MNPHVTVLTIGVANLETSLAFYRDGLGLPTEGIIGTEFDHGAVAFFDLDRGLKLALYPRASISIDTGIPVTPVNPTDFTIGHNVLSKAEVDAVIKQAELAGAFIVDTPNDRFWGGYSGHFQDPDGHLWEVVWNPAMT